MATVWAQELPPCLEVFQVAELSPRYPRMHAGRICLAALAAAGLGQVPCFSVIGLLKAASEPRALFLVPLWELP